MNFDYVEDKMWKELAIDFAKRWSSHDGLWFQAVERHFGMEAAIELDIEAWEKQTVLEAKRIMKLLGMEPGGGLEALETALKYRTLAFINEQHSEKMNDNTLIFYMDECRVQRAREQKQMDAFPCKPVGLREYSKFAETIDPRIKTECLGCPPDPKSNSWHCAWKFTIA